MDEFLSIADQDISEFIDTHQFNLDRVKFCKTTGDLLDCIKNSKNKEVVEIRELIEQGYTYRAIINYSVNIYDRYEIRKKFEKHGAFSFR